MMRFLVVAVAIGSLLLIGTLPAASGQAVPQSSSAYRAASEETADRDAYLDKVQEQMEGWRKKLHEVGDSAAAKGKEAGGVAGSDLNDAWSKAEVASRRLRDSGAEEWEGAKAAFDHASHELDHAWSKITPDNK